MIAIILTANDLKREKDQTKINVDKQEAATANPALENKASSNVVPFNFPVKELHQFLKLLIGNTHICSIWHGAFLDENVVVLTTHIAQFL